MSEHQIKGIYIWSTDLDREDPEQRRYLTLVSLLDPSRTKAVARTFPCVFQQLPAEPFMELYGRALGRASTSPFAEDKTAAEAIEAYKAANRELYAKADDWRKAAFPGRLSWCSALPDRGDPRSGHRQEGPGAVDGHAFRPRGRPGPELVPQTGRFPSALATIGASGYGHPWSLMLRDALRIRVLVWKPTSP